MNVTPLVDVVLVLLIIFMVIAPQLQQDVPVNLPGIFNPDPDVEGNMDPIKVSLDTAGTYYVEDQHFDLNGITQYLVDKHLADPDRRLVLRADQGLKYAQVRDFMARAQQVGFPGLNFMVGEKHRAGAGIVEYEVVKDDGSGSGGAATDGPPTATPPEAAPGEQGPADTAAPGEQPPADAPASGSGS
jgi:biopolymer transport protein ExbD